MENFELIHRFLDGDLDVAQEAGFFGELSASDDLRQELKEQMAMKHAIQQDYKAFTPAAASTVAIFNRLGFAGGAAAAGAAGSAAIETATGSAGSAAAGAAISTAVNTSLWQSVRAFLIRHSSNFVVGLSAATAAAVAVFLMLRPASDDSVNITNKNANRNLNTVITPVESLAKSAPRQAELNSSVPKIIYKYIVVERKSAPDIAQASNETQTEGSRTELAPEQPVEVARVERSLAARSASGPRFATDAHYLSAQPIEIVRAVRNLNGGNKIGLSVEFLGSDYSYDASDKISPKHKQLANNFTLAIFKDLSDDLSVGVDYRRESFLQKYDGVEYILVGKGDNQRLVAEPTFYSQKANFQTWSVAARYKFSSFEILDVRPTLGASLGANQVGAVGRLLIGASYMPYDWFEALAAFDYSVMRFDHQNKWFTSAKNGLHVGAAVKF